MCINLLEWLCEITVGELQILHPIIDRYVVITRPYVVANQAPNLLFPALLAGFVFLETVSVFLQLFGLVALLVFGG